MIEGYGAAFSAPLVRTPWDSPGSYQPSLYCIRGAAYDRYAWAGSNRPWFDDAPDGSGTLSGGMNDAGLFGYWSLPSWWEGSVDAAFCQGVTVHLFKKAKNPGPPSGVDAENVWSISRPLNESGFFAESGRTPEVISFQFGYKNTFPLDKVDAAFHTANGTHIWFFGGNQCYLVNVANKHPDPVCQDDEGNPLALDINDVNAWPDLPADFMNGLTWAAPALGAGGHIQDGAHLVTGTAWCPVVPSARTMSYTTGVRF